MKKRYIAIGVIILFILVLGCAGSGNNNSGTSSKSDNYQSGNSSETNQEAPQEPLTILNSKLEKNEYAGYYITGTAQANKDLTYAEISAKCYGPDGSVIGSYIANMNNLKKGEKWNFKVIGPVDDTVRVTNYTIANGNSF
jgi:hypothetical protein